jgi:hypothetical protein
VSCEAPDLLIEDKWSDTLVLRTPDEILTDRFI